MPVHQEHQTTPDMPVHQDHHTTPDMPVHQDYHTTPEMGYKCHIPGVKQTTQREKELACWSKSSSLLKVSISL